MSRSHGWRMVLAPAEVAVHPTRLGIRLPRFAAIVWVIVAAAAVLIVYPLIRLVLDVFFPNGSFDTTAIVETLRDPALPPALQSTVLLILTAGPLALALGAILAWLNERTDARVDWTAGVLPIIPLLIPSVAMAIGWVFLLAPRAGFVNVLYRSLLGFDADASGPLNIYSAPGLIWVTVIATVPLAYLIVAAALRNLDPALEEAAAIFGAGSARTLLTVTLPGIRNALATAAVLVLIGVLSLFSVPVIIGSQGGIDVLAVLIFRSLNAPGGPRFDQMIVLSAFMLLAVQAAIVFEFLVAGSGRHAQIGGRSRSQVRTSLGRWRAAGRALMVAYVTAATLLPVAALCLVSLQGFWSPAIVWSKLSLANYMDIMAANSALGRAFVNSLLLGVATATALTLAAAMVAYYVQTSRGTIGRAINGLMVLPASTPHIVIGVAFLLALGSGRVSLQGSIVLLLLAYLVLGLPQASRAAGAALGQVGHELWEGSLMSGASHLRTFTRILLPTMAPGLLAGWVIVFVNSFSETSASVFISSPTASPVTGPVIVDVFRNSGTYPQIAALAVLVTLVQVSTVAVVQLVGRRPIDYRGGVTSGSARG